MISRSASLVPVPADEEPDPLVLEAIAAAENEAQEINARAVGIIKQDLELDYFAECSVGDFAADALRSRMGAEAALLLSGTFHAGLPAGRLTLGQLRKACFSTANPAVTTLSGTQILEALEIGRTPDNYNFEFKALRGAPMGIPQVSGLKIWFDPGAEDGQRIKRVQIQSKELDLNRSYRVAHTDLEVFRYGCIRLLPGQQPQYEMPTILNEVIQDAIVEAGDVSAPAGGRWIEITRPAGNL
jgi:2',3'-cyclic-nucleotide 2'-phosphodiesterase (5'-nucleotidase family)